jgi:hypothetical protein
MFGLKIAVIFIFLTATFAYPSDWICERLVHNKICVVTERVFSMVLANPDLKKEIEKQTYEPYTKLGFFSNVEYVPAKMFMLFRDVTKFSTRNIGIDQLKDKNFESAKKLKHLSLVKENIRKLEPNAFHGADVLLEIDIHDSHLEEIDMNAFNGQNKLESLSLVGNDLKVLEDHVFDPLTGLKILILAKNSIESLPEHLFAKNSNLAVLDLSSNHLKIIPNRMFNPLAHLQVLRFNGNSCIDMEFENKNEGDIKSFKYFIEESLKTCTG